ncbi:DUF4351 domain-containing protein [Nostoc sp.]|uniref:DUF4351 domain-containing protein n=1 Tax=Nostoc sp. TaxID=1180 RepID=UPI002FF982ED
MKTPIHQQSYRLRDERFGEIDSSIIKQVRSLSVEKLEALGRALFIISAIDGLVAWLEENV